MRWVQRSERPSGERRLLRELRRAAVACQRSLAPGSRSCQLLERLTGLFPAQAEALNRLVRLDVERQPVYWADADTASRIDSYEGTCLPSLALDLDVPPGLARFDHDRSLTDERVRSDKRSLSLRPANTEQDADDRPDHRCSEADTIPRMRQQKEKGKPNEEREHGSRCTGNAPSLEAA
jgi:hypothetical protein